MSNDYIMRQIEDMSRFLASVIFSKRPSTLELVTEEGGISHAGLLQVQLRRLLREKQVNAAENLLFETLTEQARSDYLPVAVDFYAELQGWSDAALAACNFSRAEIAEGLRAVSRIYGLDPDGMADI